MDDSDAVPARMKTAWVGGIVSPLICMIRQYNSYLSSPGGGEGFSPELRQVKGLLSHRQLWTLRLTRTLFQHDGIRHPEVHPLFLNCNSEPEVRTASMSRLTEEDTTLGLAVGISAGFEMQHSLLVHVAKWRIFF